MWAASGRRRGPKAVDPEVKMPTLSVQRDRGIADKLRKYRILLDGLEIGELAEEAVLSRETSSGPHVLEARIDWCGSQPLSSVAHNPKETVNHTQ
jgi:hypothetical protein